MPIDQDREPVPPAPPERQNLLEVLAELQPLAEEDYFPEIDDTPLSQAVLPDDTSR